jgi:hypothetical protein
MFHRSAELAATDHQIDNEHDDEDEHDWRREPWNRKVNRRALLLGVRKWPGRLVGLRKGPNRNSHLVYILAMIIIVIMLQPLPSGCI